MTFAISRLFMIFSPEELVDVRWAAVVSAGFSSLGLSQLFVGHFLSPCVLRASVHFGGPYAAVQPPSIERLAPVICAASWLHRNSASEATCSTVTNSFVGWAASRTSLIT
jgi:hypothetical protein